MRIDGVNGAAVMEKRWGMTTVHVAVLAGMLFGWCMVAQGNDEGQALGEGHRVVMHLSSGDEKAQRGVLNNIKNLYEALQGKRLTLELVAHGAGLSLFVQKETKLARELAGLKEKYGVSYTACSNTMKARNLTRPELIGQVDRTSPAMVRLMELQEQGWAYIKP